MAVNTYASYEEYSQAAGDFVRKKQTDAIQYANDAYAAAESAAATARDSAYSYAEGERVRAEEAARTGLSDANAAADARQSQSIVLANDAFERDKVTYGQAAERLAQAGLTGSGFSDNLTRDAFASRATLYADANRTNAAEKHAAEVTYRDAMAKAAGDEADSKYKAESEYDAAMATAAAEKDKGIYDANATYDSDILELEGEMLKYGEEKARNLETIVTGVKNGEYNADDIARLAKAYGFSEPEVEGLNKALSDRQALVAQTITNEIRQSFTPDENGNVSPAYTLADIDALVTAGEITADHATALKEQQNAIVKNMFADLDRACRALKRDSKEGKEKRQEFNDALKEVEALAKNGYIEMQTYYECLYDIYNPWVMEWANPEAYTPYTPREKTVVEKAMDGVLDTLDNMFGQNGGLKLTFDGYDR